MTTLDEVRKTIEAVIGNLTPAKAAGSREGPVRPGNREGTGVEDGGRHARVVPAEPRPSERGDLARDRFADEVDGRCDAGRSGCREEAGPRFGASSRHDRVRSGLGCQEAGGEEATADEHEQEDREENDREAGGERRIVGISSMPRRRLDVELVRRGLASSRAEAQAAVEAGRVTVAGSPVTKAASLVTADAPVQVLGPARRFVSRGGEKLRSGPRSLRGRPARPRLSRRRRVDGRVHRLPAAAGRGARRGRRRRLRPAGVVDPQRPPRHGDGAHERPGPRARSVCRSRRTSSSPTSRSSRCARCCRRSCAPQVRDAEFVRAGEAAVRGGAGRTWGAGGVVRDPEVWRRGPGRGGGGVRLGGCRACWASSRRRCEVRRATWSSCSMVGAGWMMHRSTWTRP